MLFQRKVDRALNLLKEKNRARSMGASNLDGIKDNSETEDNDSNKLKLEKHDLAAIIISALLVFAPILIILIIIIAIVF